MQSGLAMLTEFHQAHYQSTLEDAIMLYREAQALFPESHPLQWKVLWELSEGLLIQFWLTGNVAQVEEAISCLEQVQKTKPNQLVYLCAALMAGYEAPKGFSYVLHGMDLVQQIAKNTQKGLTLVQRSVEFLVQFNMSRDIQFLEKHVRKLEEAEPFLPSVHKGRAVVLDILGKGLYSLFQYNGNAVDLKSSIELLREFVALQDPSDPAHGTSLIYLVQALYHQFKNTGNPEDIHEIVELSREALGICATPHQLHRVSLNNLAVVLNARFEQQGDLNDINEAIKLSREVLKIRVTSHSEHSDSLSNLGNALHARFQIQRDMKDLEEAITLHREASEICAPPDPEYSRSLNNLANTICTRYEEQGDLRDIYAAIELHRKVLETRVAPHPQRSNTLYNLAGAIAARFKRQRDPKDLEEVIELNRKVLDIATAPYPTRIGSCHNLALALQGRFQDRGDPKDIDEAIDLHREMVEMCPVTHLNRNRALSNLATAIYRRYDQRRDSRDIDESIELHRKALEICIASHLDRAHFVHNLAVAFQTRFEGRRDLKDIDEAMKLHRELLDTSPHSYSGRSILLHDLAIAFHARFEKTKDHKDIDEAIELHRKALSMDAASHQPRHIFLMNLAFALHSRFKQQRDHKDIDEAVDLHQEALVLCPSPHRNRGRCLQNYGNILHEAYVYQRNEETLDAAISVLQEASLYMSSSPVHRFSAANNWAEIATMYGHSSCLTAYHTYIDLLPQLVAFHLDLKSRQEVLAISQITSLASASATCAIALNENNFAVEFLEASRSVFWAQALRLRTPLDQLANVEPELATRLRKLSRQLDQASFRDTPQNVSTDGQQNIRSIEAVATRCHRLNEEWEETIEAVHKLAGFEDLMRSKSITLLRQAAISGPIVILLASKSSCSALIVTSSQDIQHMQLPRIDLQTLKLYADLPRALSDRNFDMTNFLEARGHAKDFSDPSELEYRLYGAREDRVNMSSDDIFRRHLADIWEKIVKPLFEFLNLKKSEHPPRLWWCPTGPFTFIPIHAAGIYAEDGADCTADYVVSSYTPTLTALLDPPAETAASFKVTAVVEGNAPNCTPLPGIEEELSKIMDRVPKEWLTALLSPTGSEVVENLQESSIMHFACHGIQDSNNPLDSGLMLSDGRLKVSQIMHKPLNVNREGTSKLMSLAFLSACETAKGDGSTPDEALHLAGTLLFTGFRGVVATMWSIDDQDGPKVADAFYDHLFKNCDAVSNPPILPDLTKAAEALYFAVSKLRKEPGMTFKRWVPFVHYGL
ncbi:CHAT domain-containing protein [Mycena epipterygia]|nr:CHAT domain-containing protein [Mycena epipterygia]